MGRRACCHPPNLTQGHGALAPARSGQWDGLTGSSTKGSAGRQPRTFVSRCVWEGKGDSNKALWEVLHQERPRLSRPASAATPPSGPPCSWQL